MLDIIKKIKQLTKKINQANYEYFNLNQSSLSDQQYDELLQELIYLEQNYPQYKLKNSPTDKVGSSLDDNKIPKITHSKPMLSLDNAFDITKVKKFYTKIMEKYPHCNFITELKIDGIAINLKYKQGILMQATTRGNGLVGEVVTHNIKNITDIPLKLLQPIDLEVRGEVFFNYENFKKLNEQHNKEQKKSFANPRNAASGTIRLLNPNIVASRNLSSFLYSIVKTSLIVHTQKEVLELLKKLGFSVNPYYHIINSWSDLINFIDYYVDLKTSLNYDVDGIVIKLNQLDLYPKIGYTNKFPKYALAYKFNSITGETIIKNILFYVGRTGIINPVADLEPIILDGSKISRVTLHNYNYIQNKDIRIHDSVIIVKSGSIIPRIIKVIINKRVASAKPFVMITKCPSCDSLLKKENNGINYFCINSECNEKKIQKIIHFASKEAMDIHILGSQTLTILFKNKIINKISDLYILKEKKQQLLKLPFFGIKKINNILEAIEKSKQKPFDRVLFGLGIKHVGSKIAQILTNKFYNIYNLKKATIEQLTKINEIGQEIAHSIHNFFNDEKNVQEIIQLEKHQLNFSTQNIINNVDNNFFKNQKIIITGTLSQYTRAQIIKNLSKLGALIVNNISKKTNYLICGANYSKKKLEKAKNINITIIQELELYKLLSQTKNKI
ncbi:NAD-dependent DNA ligase LigA ['Crotalaria aegyptiaca' phytoplasma]|uniref:DNA ligase n=1 Tax=Candidatus Phytoplasma crotalariae TaxID=2982627 RepID=A0ABT9D1Y6_9MOLU|nr:NAD-dependent DNA ligase LigA ['Crotalaria aegyptiaca' phytoplasma]MDO8059033.1 NAD-dependent DNA ligase LigA ['Crotalaria aegyptiaca' phytoplasma]